MKPEENGEGNSTPRPRYRVQETEPAEAEREQAFLHFMALLGPDYAGRWYKDLRRAIDELAAFPGPLSHARDEEASAHYGYEVRRMLYHGPMGKRRARTPYRVLFTLLPPAEGHGAQRLFELPNA